MALKPCRECGNPVSTEAKACPKCGAVVRSQSPSGCAVGCVLIFALALYVMHSCTEALNRPLTPAEREAREYDRTALDVRMACEEAVRSRLAAPSTARFPAQGRVVARERGDTTRTRWIVRGDVDAQNAFAAQIRSNYECVVEHRGPSAIRIRAVDVR